MLSRPRPVRFEHHPAGRLGIGETEPRLSWIVDDAPTGYRQEAAEIEIRVAGPGRPETATVHALDTDEQVLVAWPAAPLHSRERASVRVRVRSGRDWSEWSEPGRIEVGLLEEADWTARFVGPAWPEDAERDRRPVQVRADFTAPGDIALARLYLTAHGLAEAEVNGVRIGDEELTPGWTSYHHRLRYATFDISDQLVPGENAIGIRLADGWWRGRVGFEGGKRNVYGSDVAALAQIELETTDGTRHIIGSDDSWMAGYGSVLASSIYDGETEDRRLVDATWSTPGWSDAQWSPVTTAPARADLLVAPTGPPVRYTEELRPVSSQRRGDTWLLDFGQNHSGRLRIRGEAPEGTTVTLRHAEVLQHGEFFTRTLRDAAATDSVILEGGSFDWEPRFTIHGYRYAEVSGWPGELTADSVVSRVLHTDMERTGWFRSSNPKVDRLHENALWSTRSNFVDLPMDCPQRDERLGWTGDIQVFAPTASFLYSVTGMLASWLQDVAAEQKQWGAVPFYVPYIPLGGWQGDSIDPVAVWGDVAVLTPDVLHRRTGDVALLRRQYESAVTWMNHVEEHASPELLCTGTQQLGDWLDPAAPPENPGLATTDPVLVATAYFAHSARRIAAVASVIGEHEDARRYRDLADQVAAAYARAFLLPGGRCVEDTQTAYSLTTVFELWPDDEARAGGTARLAELVHAAGGRIATGFAGTPVVSDALTIGDELDAAYRLLLTEECPAWLYTIAMGATTIWERWDSMLPDGTVNPGDMTSFNHYALGAVADWLHRVVAGLAPADTAYRRIRFEPRPGGGLTSAGASHRTPYGTASIDWEIVGDELRTEIVVPVGATAEVVLPGAAAVVVEHGRHRFVTPAPATVDRASVELIG